MTRLSFLGTGNYLTPANRYWNGFVVDDHVLVETSPTTLPHLRRLGIPVSQLDCVLISHFHPDHTFGWPFLLLELARSARDRSRPLTVVGPPGVAAFFEEMMRFGSVMDVYDEAHDVVDISYVDVDRTWQTAGPIRFRAVEVEHVVELQCFGYLIETGDGVVGYSGDTHPCPGLDELAEHAGTLVLECNGLHASKSHMDVESVNALHARHPATRLVVTHLGEGVDRGGFAAVTIPEDLETLEV